jgi:hypothetical protein
MQRLTQFAFRLRPQNIPIARFRHGAHNHKPAGSVSPRRRIAIAVLMAPIPFILAHYAFGEDPYPGQVKVHLRKALMGERENMAFDLVEREYLDGRD